jgi:hypothetical protein
MTIGIIDNKKINLTSDEWAMYRKITASYTTHTNKGEDLFIDLFETDDNGIILFLKPPSKRQTSFEVFCFLMSVMQHQHIRLMYEKVEDICLQLKNKSKEIDDKTENLNKTIADMNLQILKIQDKKSKKV